MSTTLFRVHGREVDYHGEICGIYKSSGLSYSYAIMDPTLLFCRINELDVEQARASVDELHNMAKSQAEWRETPHNLGYPILTGPAPCEVGADEREGIINLQGLCERIIVALSKKR